MEPEYITIEKINSSNLNREQLMEQGKLRIKLIREMVGNFYPNIIRDEIREIEKIIENI